MQHILFLAVSFKLEKAFDYDSSSWASVLWPLWGVAGFFGMTLLLAACCGLPLVLRRTDAMRTHLGCLFSSGLVLSAMIFCPAVVAAVRLAAWLDGNARVTAAMILYPYILSLCTMLVGLFTSLAVVCFSPRITSLPPNALGGAGAEEDNEALFPALPAPMALVRESSTLFRRVSTATLDKYAQRHPQSDGGGDEGGHDEDIEEGGGGGQRHTLLSRLDGAISNGSEGHRTTLLSDGARSDCSSVEEMAAPTLAADAVAASLGRGSGGRTAGEPSSTSLGDVELSEIVAHDQGSRGGAEAGVTESGGAATAACSGTSTGCGAVASEGGDELAAASSTLDTLARPATSSEADALDDGLDGDTCWICCNGPRDAVLLECGHGGLCFQCASKCSQKRPPLCPMCRQRITRVVQLEGPEEVVDGEVVVSLCKPAE